MDKEINERNVKIWKTKIGNVGCGVKKCEKTGQGMSGCGLGLRFVQRG